MDAGINAGIHAPQYHTGTILVSKGIGQISIEQSATEGLLMRGATRGTARWRSSRRKPVSENVGEGRCETEVFFKFAQGSSLLARATECHFDDGSA